MTLKVLSLFSGVGGFDLGLERATMETVYQCEIDKNCRAILEKHWPLVPKWDDITTLTGKEILENAPVIDVVAWGSPCQDLSVAGKRAGLAGEESNLFYEGIRIINELRKATNGKYPAISIWENVAGALNSNIGNDFGLILDEMAKSGATLIEWGLLDAQYFGIPQRRRRVFVVAIFNTRIAERCPDPLLPIGKSLHRDIKTRGKTKQNTTEQIENGTTDTSFTGSSYGNYSPGVGTLRSNGGDLGGGSETLILDTPILAFDTQFGSNANVTERGATIRRLTPKECERLMGWPDDHTRWRADGKEQTDGHRYRQCGNGVASPVATWIGEQIVKVTNQTKEGNK
jgi:DNA (cytosine-5)-methyltransferase 1